MCLDMARKPVSIEVIQEGNERYVALTYANGDVEKQRVQPERKARRRPRRPQTRLNLQRNKDQ
jgi:hypothetical protein